MGFCHLEGGKELFQLGTDDRTQSDKLKLHAKKVQAGY